MINFKPVTDRVAIRLLPQETVSNGGIILSDDALKPRNVGVVEAIGPLVRADIKVGDTVLFHCFDDLPTYDPEVVMVRDNSLLGVFA